MKTSFYWGRVLTSYSYNDVLTPIFYLYTPSVPHVVALRRLLRDFRPLVPGQDPGTPARSLPVFLLVRVSCRSRSLGPEGRGPGGAAPGQDE